MTAGKRAAGGKPAKPPSQRRLFVLDTNVLMHDPTAIFRFQEHDVYLPMVVLEELDANKKGLSEASRNVRQVSRFLDDLMRDATKDQIDAGLPLPSAQGIGLRTATAATAAASAARSPAGCSSRRASSPRPCRTICPDTAPTTPSWRRPWRCRRCTTKRASRWSPRTSTCASRRRWSAYTPRTTTATRPSKTPTCSTRGSRALPADFWESHGKDMRSWKEAERTYYEISGPVVTRTARQPVRARGSPRPASKPSCGASKAARPRSSWRATTAPSATASGA